MGCKLDFQFPDRRFVSILFASTIWLMGILCLDNTQALLLAQQKNPDLYLRAPDVIPGTLPEMRQPSYWIAKMKNPDAIVLTPEEIKSRNDSFKNRMKNWQDLNSTLVQRIEKQIKSRPGLMASIPNTNTLSDVELVDLIRDMIQSQTDYLYSRPFANIMAIEYSADELQEIAQEIAYDPARAQSPANGIVIRESRLHVIPSIKPEHVGLFTKGKAKWDLWNLDVLPIGTPVQILFASRTGAFLLVICERGYGWVPSQQIATGNDQEITAFTDREKFMICTDDRVAFYSDPQCTVFEGWLRMGDRLPVAGNSNTSIIAPHREANGGFTTRQAYLRAGADVHPGYLPYTQKNVALQAFKLLDNLYDWTGAWLGRNHVTNLRDVFRCFGFDLPANGVLLAAYQEQPLHIEPDLGRETQLKYVLENRPFLTLQICENSHSQMFLGGYEGMPIVFDAHGYSYPDQDGNDLEIKRWVVSTMEMPDYFLKQDITFVRLY